GSLFMSQYFMEWTKKGSDQFSYITRLREVLQENCSDPFFIKERFPASGGGLAPEPWLNRVVAYRSHQVRPARPRRGTIATVTTGSATWGSYRFGKIKPCRALQGTRPF